MLRNEVAQWLNSKNNVTNVREVTVYLGKRYWHGVAYTEGDEDRYYLLGFHPKQSRPSCYQLSPFDDKKALAGIQYDWYVGGYYQGESTEVHPFGSHWIVVPWIIEGEPDSRIDDDSDDQYVRLFLMVEEH